ncbi:lipase 3 [Aethina tumida]|uniref:lipase 3 n=1 Tax=Aethina tumida TaxID=116153 RepID=UPI002148C655|nr:lipase 3 [Aethina tumida]
MKTVIILFGFCCIQVVIGAKCNFLEKWIRPKRLCQYNPDEILDTVQFARKHGYDAESHTVLTKDGYLLTLHRIPGPKSGKRGGQPIFLQHGLLASSFDWVVNYNISLGFILADLGYDVWLGNARGNTYSKAHVSLPTDSAEFWNFSFHEMAIYDLPASLSYVSNVTRQGGDIIYIGHSMGTTMYFIFSSLMPEAARDVKVMVALAPVAYMTHIKTPIRYLSPFVNDVEWLNRFFGLNQFLPNNRIIKILSAECERNSWGRASCENIVFILCGFDKKEFNHDNLGVILHHTPAGASTKTILHYAHEIKNQGKFQHYDYGADGNKKRYGTENPPDYNISNIETPIYLMYGLNDWLASPIDVLRLSSKLPHLIGSYEVKMDSWNHVDFIFGKDADKMVNKPLLKVIFNYTANEY